MRIDPILLTNYEKKANEREIEKISIAKYVCLCEHASEHYALIENTTTTKTRPKWNNTGTPCTN